MICHISVETNVCCYLLQIPVLASGCGIDVPIYVEREEMDLRVCMVDQLYQDSVLLHNRLVASEKLCSNLPD